MQIKFDRNIGLAELLDALKDNSHVSGRIEKDGGVDARFEQNAPRVLFTFRRLPVAEVRAMLAFDYPAAEWVVITEII